MPTMCLKFVSEEGLAHISESPLPVDLTAATTTCVPFPVDFTAATTTCVPFPVDFTATTTAGVALPVDVTTVNEPLDGILC